MYDNNIGNHAFLNELNSLAKGIEQSSKSAFRVLIMSGKATLDVLFKLIELPLLKKSLELGKVEFVDGAPREQHYSHAEHPPNRWDRF